MWTSIKSTWNSITTYCAEAWESYVVWAEDSDYGVAITATVVGGAMALLLPNFVASLVAITGIYGLLGIARCATDNGLLAGIIVIAFICIPVVGPTAVYGLGTFGVGAAYFMMWSEAMDNAEEVSVTESRNQAEFA